MLEPNPDELLSQVRSSAEPDPDQLLKSVRQPTEPNPDELLKSVRSSVAQPVEQRPVKAKVPGSIPGAGATPTRSGEAIEPPETPAPTLPSKWLGQQAWEFASEIPQQLAGIPGALTTPVAVKKRGVLPELRDPNPFLSQPGSVLAGMLAGEPGAQAYQTGSLEPLTESPGKTLANLLFNLNQARMLGAAGAYGTARGLGRLVPREGIGPFSGQLRITPGMESVEGITTRTVKQGWAGPPEPDLVPYDPGLKGGPAGPRAQTAFPWGEEQPAQQTTGKQFKKTEDAGIPVPEKLAPLKSAEEDHRILSGLVKEARAAGDTDQVNILAAQLRQKTQELSGLREQLGPLDKEYDAAKAVWAQMFGTQGPSNAEALSRVRLAGMKAAQSAELPGLEGKPLSEFMQQHPGLPPVLPGFVRLFRGEGMAEPGQPPLPDWIEQAKHMQGIYEAEGRWFHPLRGEAEWYANEAENGRLFYVDLPERVANDSLINNLPEDHPARRFSARPNEEHFLPREIAETKQQVPFSGIEQLSAKLQSGDLYKELQEAGIWSKAETQKALDLELGVAPQTVLGQTEMAFLRDPTTRAVRIVQDALVMDEALRAGSGAFGPLQTIRTVVPKTWAEQLLKSGLPGYRLTSELRSMAYEYEASSSRLIPDLVMQEVKALKDELGSKSWAYEYFTSPKTRADIDDLYYGTEGQKLLKKLYGKVQDDSQRLKVLGLHDQTPEFMQDYLTQSHMKLWELKDVGWRPPGSVIDRFVTNIQASARMNGKDLSVAQAQEIAESLISQKATSFYFGAGQKKNMTLSGGQNDRVLLNRKDLPDWVKDMYGPLPPGPTAYGFTRMEQSRLLLFDRFAQHLEDYEIPTLQGPARAVVDTPVAGYSQLPDNTKSWGRLAGRYVQDDIVPVLRLMTEPVQRAITARMLDFSKRMWVVANIPSWIRYAFGNLAFITLGGGIPNPLKPVEMAAAARAMKDVAVWGWSRNMPQGMQALLEKGAFAGLPVGASGDIVGFSREDSFRKFVKENYQDLLTMPDEQLPSVPFERIVSGIFPTPVQEMFAKAYKGINTSAQQGFLMSHMYARVLNAYVLQSRGLSLDQTMSEIAKWHPFYMIPSPFGATLKGITPSEPVIPGLPKLNTAFAQLGGALGSPVPSFNMETIRIYEQALREKPFQLAAIHGLPLLFNTMTSAMATGKPSGLTDIESSLPTKDFSNARQRFHLLVPGRNGLNYVDLDNVIPGGRMMSDPVAEMLGNPIIPEIEAMVHNHDPATGQDIVKPGESWVSTWSKRVAERLFTPPMISQMFRDIPLAAEYGVNRRLGAEYEETPTGAAAHDILGFLHGAIPIEDLQQAKDMGDFRDVKSLIKELKTQGLSHSKTQAEKESRTKNILDELAKPR
jgi:hypothetical protein